MNRQFVAGTILGVAAAAAIGAFAGYQILGSDADDYADVVSVEPVTETISEPREVCHDKVVDVQKPVKDEHQIAGTVAGAVIGGVLGNQVGDGSGQDIATAAGAVAGGYAGNKVQEKIQEGNTEQQLQQVCETVYDTRQVQDGYEVTYELDGEEHVVYMDYDPGRRIALENGRPVLDPLDDS
jgi:uncharacterized protein YcfJ